MRVLEESYLLYKDNCYKHRENAVQRRKDRKLKNGSEKLKKLSKENLDFIKM